MKATVRCMTREEFIKEQQAYEDKKAERELEGKLATLQMQVNFYPLDSWERKNCEARLAKAEKEWELFFNRR
jgi:hypothetical protein